MSSQMSNVNLAAVAGAAAGMLGIVYFIEARRRSAEKLSENRQCLVRLTMRILASPLPVDSKACEGAYLFQQLDCNLASTAFAAAELVRRCPTTRLLVFDVNNEKLPIGIPNGYGGATTLLASLNEANVPMSQVDLVPYDHETHRMVHTLVEAQCAVRHAKKKGWKSLLVVAPPFHLLRASMTTASVAAREAPDLSIHAFAGCPLAWEETAVHSQGMVGTRHEIFDSEMMRIERYTEKGDILPWAELEKMFR
eukprot:TRINITY_DN20971_c0_g3_i1.p1 TRINITY_DN20971_c0_g3~~TRINITY_DN20971_c0_g3_i1.p1  ORF type:complete len:252 (-),score=48.16 TRINITY_DN20971_c0_g3_i1:128-883(-)